MRFAAIVAGLALIGAAGLAAGGALAGGLPVPTISTTTVSVPNVTSTISKVTSTVPKITTTVPKITTTVPKVTTTVPKVTTTVPKITTTVPKVTTSVPTIGTTTPKLPGPTPTVGTTTVKAPSPVAGGGGSTSSSGNGGSPAAGGLPGLSSPVGGLGTAATGFAAPSSSGSSFAAAAAASSAPAADNVSSSPQASAHASRTYITAGKRSKRGALMVTFRLPRRARVVLTVFERYPVCRRVASFTVVGHQGVNRLKIRGRIAGKLLEPGTYSVTARIAGGAPLFQLVLAVVKTRPTAKQLAVERNRNTCSSPALMLVSASDGAGGALTARLLAPKRGKELVRAQNPIPVVGPTTEAPPAASAFSPTRLSQKATNPFVIGALAAAMLLLGLASLPRTAIPDPRLNDAVVRHRPELAVTGTMLLAAAAFVLFLG